jgi:integrase
MRTLHYRLRGRELCDLLTGQRLSEVKDLQVAELNLPERVWFDPRDADGSARRSGSMRSMQILLQKSPMREAVAPCVRVGA